MNKPLPIAFILFITGIIFAHRLPVSFPAVIGLTALFFILLLLFRRTHRLVFYIISSGLVLLLGAAAYLNYNKLSSNHIAHLLKDKLDRYYVQGVIVSSPDYSWTRWGKRRCSFLLKAERYKDGNYWVKINGLSKIEIKDSQEEYSYGDNLLIFGRLKRPAQAANPGQFDYAGHLRSRRIHTLIELNSDDDISLLKGKRSLILKKLLFGQRADIEKLIKRYLSGEDAAILSAMLIGRQAALSKRLRERFVKTGTAHVLSISGLHLVIISAMAFFILRFIRIPRKISGLIVIVFLVIYALFAGARPPILRATIMIAVYFLGYILERDFDIYSAISLAGILILLINPLQLFNAGFVLSFACVFSIGYLTPRLEALLSTRTWFAPAEKNPVTRYILRLILGSLAVYIGVAPLIGYYFNIVSPITVIANLFIVPLLGVVLFSGILFIIAGSLFAPLAALFSCPVHLILLVFTKIIFFLSNIPFGYFYIPDIPLYAMAIYYIFILSVIKRKNLGLNWVKISAAALLIINIFIWKTQFRKQDQLRATFLDLPGSDSAFLEFPNGKTMLINAGRRMGFYCDQGQSIVLPFIWSRGRRSIDCLFLTHSDSAHLGAALSVLEKAGVRYFISCTLQHKDRLYKMLRELIVANRVKDIEVKQGVRIEGFDDASILVMGPGQLKVTYKEVSFLLRPKEKIIQLREERPQAVDTKNCGAITIITDGFQIQHRGDSTPILPREK